MKVTIDDRVLEVQPGLTILEAARQAGIRIPTLCYLKEINELSACRICVVQVNGSPRLVPSCSTRVSEGMIVETDNEYVRRARRNTLELITADHRMECTDCPRGADCELRDLCKDYEVDDHAYGSGFRACMMDESTSYLVRDNSKCILCRRCVSTCANVQGIGAIAPSLRGDRTNIGFPAGLTLSRTKCVACGQCVAACPTGALSVRDNTKEVWRALYNKGKYVVMAVTPAAARTIGKLFGEKDYRDNSGKITAILKKIGFDLVIDQGAWEPSYRQETAREIISRMEKGEGPLLSSSDQAWVNFIRKHRPDREKDLLRMPSLAEYAAGQVRSLLPDRDICYVSIDTELAARTGDGKAVDIHLTVPELFALIRRACVSSFTAEQVWRDLDPEPYDVIPGIPGIRGTQRDTAKASVIGDESIAAVDGSPDDIEKSLCRKQISYRQVFGMKNAAKALEELRQCDFLEVCASPGGPLFAGGAPCPVPVWRTEPGTVYTCGLLYSRSRVCQDTAECN